MLVTLAFICIIFSMFLTFFFNAGSIKTAFIEGYRLTVPTGAPILERAEGAIDTLEEQIDEHIAYRDGFNEIYGASQLAMNKKIMRDPNYGNLFKTTYGQITYSVKEKTILPYVSRTVELASQIEAAGIPFLYVQAPFKLPADEQQLPGAYTDYSNVNADRFLALINAYGVKSYDLREDFWNTDKTQNELFFNTDHHWTIDSAFYATGLLEQYLNENYDFGIDEKYYNIDSYIRTTYKDNFIGSMGRRVGRIYGGIDDFTLITPNFETNLTLTEWNWGTDTVYQGSFEDAILVDDYITPAEPETNRYAVYHGDYTKMEFVNHLVDNDKRILIIKDSFGVPVYSFLSLGIKEVAAIDVRIFDQDVAQYAIDFNPDLVVLFYNADSLNKEMFQFKEKILTPTN